MRAGRGEVKCITFLLYQIEIAMCFRFFKRHSSALFSSACKFELIFRLQLIIALICGSVFVKSLCYLFMLITWPSSMLCFRIDLIVSRQQTVAASTLRSNMFRQSSVWPSVGQIDLPGFKS